MKDGKYLYSDLDGRVYLRIKAGSYECLTADTNTGWEEGERGDVDELIPSMWELIEDPEITDLREQLAKANERVKEFDKQRKAIAFLVYESSIDELDNEIEIDADVLAEKVFNVIGISAAQLRKEQE